MKQRFTVAQPWLSTAARLFLAGVFIWAGWPKLIDGDGTIRSVRAFQILPEVTVVPFAYALPLVELALALLLTTGLFTRAAAVATAGMMVMFMGGIINAWAHGLTINCGCFGNTGDFVNDPTAGYVKDLLRDTGFLLLAMFLAWWPVSLAAADRFLHPAPSTART